MTQPQMLRVTCARVDQVQTWLNRGHLIIQSQNPGRGKSRLYGELDAIKIGVMARLTGFGVAVNRTVSYTEHVERRLTTGKPIRWKEFFHIGFCDIDRTPIGTFYSPDSQGVLLNMSEGDAEHLIVATFSEWFRSIEGVLGGPRRRDDRLEIDTAARDEVATVGRFAEPFLFFPLGEVVNGISAQVRALAGA